MFVYVIYFIGFNSRLFFFILYILCMFVYIHENQAKIVFMSPYVNASKKISVLGSLWTSHSCEILNCLYLEWMLLFDKNSMNLRFIRIDFEIGRRYVVKKIIYICMLCRMGFVLCYEWEKKPYGKAKSTKLLTPFSSHLCVFFLFHLII